MRKLDLNHAHYLSLEKRFAEWLKLLGYAPSTVYNLPNAIREFFHFLEAKDCNRIEAVTPALISEYYNTLKHRPRDRTVGSLSTAYLKKHAQALKLLAEFLEKTGQASLLVDLPKEKVESRTISVFTREEVRRLYAITDTTPLGLRDRAMLAVFYGSGLRRTEGISLDLSLIHI